MNCTIYQHSFSLQSPPSSFFIFATRKLWNYLVQVFGFSSFLLSDYTSLHFTGTDLALSNSRELFPTVMYEEDFWLSKFRTMSFEMLCYLIKNWICHWNVNCSSFSIPGAVEIFEVVAIRPTIFISDHVVLFKTFRVQLTVNAKWPRFSTNIVSSFIATIPLAKELVTL